MTLQRLSRDVSHVLQRVLQIDFDDDVDNDDEDFPVCNTDDSDHVTEADKLDDVAEMLDDDASDEGGDSLTCKSGRGTIEWFKHEQRRGRRAPQNVLEVPPGLSERSKNCASASSAFKLFIAEEMVATIVHEANRRAQSVYRQWNKDHKDNQKI